MSASLRAVRVRSAFVFSALVTLTACAPPARRDAGSEPEDVAAGDAAEVVTAPDATADAPVLDAADAMADAPVLDVALDTPAPDTMPDALPDVAADAPREASPMTCTGGLTACAGRCVDIAMDRMHCGACDTPCSNAAHSTGACNAGECENVCEPGFADCDGMLSTGCEADLSETTHCGACTRRCTAGQICASGACVGAEMAPPPRLYAPSSGARVARRRAELQWFSVSGAGGTQVQVCRQRACTEVVATVESSGNRASVPMDLEPGVYFWRARSGAAGRYGTSWSPVWQFRVPYRDSMAGRYWGAEPDFNGDGYADIAVGAYARMTLSGAAYVFYGSRTGPRDTPDWTVLGFDGINASYGMWVGAVGDVNGDGFVDLGVGSSESAFEAGRVYIYLGSAVGLPMRPSFTITGPEGLSGLGTFVTALGDVNNDGYADLSTSAPINGGFAEGAVYVYLGRASGEYTSASQIFRNMPAIPQHRLGFGLSVAGDVNNDGFTDLVAGARGNNASQSAVYLFSGGASGFGATPSQTLRGMGTETAPRLGEYFGVSVAGVGDVNGDGYADVMVGAAGGTNFDGYARLYLGSSAGLLTEPAWERRGVGSELFGFSVSGGADVNGDGFDDMIVASASTGRARVLYGSLSGPSGDGTQLSLADGSSLGAQRVVLTGDVDGDGYPDALVGAPSLNGERGRVYWFRGGRDGLATRPAWFYDGTDMGSRFGDAVGRW